MFIRQKRKDEKGTKLSRRNFLKISALCGGAFALDSLSTTTGLSFAKDVYPAKKITWLIPYAAGGGYDMIARVMSPYIAKYLREVSPGAKGGDLVIKDEPASSGRKAYSMAYYAKPDGYTISFFDLAFATETLMSPLEFDINKFTYLLRVNTTSRILVTRKAGFSNWEEMVKSAQKTELRWGIHLFGRATHIASIIIKEALAIPAHFVPTGGAALNLNALIRGDIHVTLISEDTARGLLDAGEIKILADFTGKGGYPGVPSLKDLGHPELIEKIEGHRFVIGPPALPQEISNILISAFKKTMTDQQFRSWAEKSDIPLHPIYGEEAESVAKRIFKFYQQEMKPILMKYLS